jgi:glycosyltransferase involved in cell wall biosynthesis
MSPISDEEGGVSVILCCHNSAQRLPETLRHLARQETPAGIAWEVLVVDNASQDDTAKVAQETWKACGAPAPLRVVSQPVSGLSYAREKGIAESRHGVLVFCDDDNWLSPGYLRRSLAILQNHPEVALAGGWGTPEPEGIPPCWLADFSDVYGTGPQGEREGIAPPTMTFYGAGVVVRKKDYQDLVGSGFRFFLSGRQGGRLTTGEDRELCHALVLRGKKLYYDPQLKFRHYIPSARASWNYYRKMMLGCVPAGLVLQAYHLRVLCAQSRRPAWKNSHAWTAAMMVWSQLRKVGQTSGRYLRKGYCKFWWLEIELLPRIVWTWLTRKKVFQSALHPERGAVP